ncbi:endo-chitosanase [Chaetomidium leptoderma]|uniref:Endo-chitosanase n=1 Tax=Chaetomidium leptoderma TaxID=669021 RepID=A0AAN6VJH4_9PEZI|nr:endo-chitosanase [Chaetomidium leptoderma]
MLTLLLSHWMGRPVIQLLLLSLATVGSARDAPQNLRDFYDSVRAKGHCSNELASGFYSRANGPNTFSYCGDQLSSSGVIFLQGRDGALANMDVDCDGVAGAADDGRCRYSLSPDVQNVTTFRDLVAGYNKGVKDLNPYVHPYVVFGNAPGTRGRSGWRAFDPTEHGMRPLSVMAVVCPNRKVVYGIWGDTNGDDGSKPMVGEASLSLVTACGGPGVTGDNGIDEDAALFVGFTGDEAVPGPDGADWAAKDFDTFERSIEALGDRLVGRVGTEDSGASCIVKPDLTGAAIAAVVAALVVRGLR